MLSGPELDEARALRAGQAALAQLRAVLGRDGGRPPDAARVHRVLEQLEVHVGDTPQPDRVQVASPESIRARRFEAVFVCGLQEGEFPRGATSEPFLSDDDRRAIATASGLVLPVREDRLDRERYLFYVCASRAERLLVLSSRSSDEEGNPEAESFFVDDVRELFTAPPDLRTRSLADVTWTPDSAPTAAEWDRALAAAGPRRDEPPPGRLSSAPLLAELSARDAVSAGAIERFADCPVKWLVESLLDPEKLAPDPEQMVRGRYAHTVLEHTFRRLRDETGERRVSHANLAHAERILLEELHARRSDFQLSPKETRVRAAARRLEFDLLRFLRSEADSDGSFEPDRFELPVRHRRGRRAGGDRRGPARARAYRPRRRERRDGARARLQERQARRQLQGRQLGAREPLPGRPLHAGRGTPARRCAPPAACTWPLGKRQTRGRAGWWPPESEELGSGFFPGDRLDSDEFREKLDWALARIRETDALHAPGRALREARQLRLERRLQLPLDLPERAVSELTPEQRRGGRAPRRLAARPRRSGHRQDHGARRALRQGGAR